MKKIFNKKFAKLLLIFALVLAIPAVTVFAKYVLSADIGAFDLNVHPLNLVWEEIGTSNVFNQVYVDYLGNKTPTENYVVAGNDLTPETADDNMLAGRSEEDYGGIPLNLDSVDKENPTTYTIIGTDESVFYVDGGVDKKLGTYDDVIRATDSSLGMYQINSSTPENVGWNYLYGSLDNMLVATEYVLDNIAYYDSFVDTGYIYKNSNLFTKMQNMWTAFGMNTVIVKDVTNLDMDHTDFLGNEVYMCTNTNTSHTHAIGNCTAYGLSLYTTHYLTTPQDNIDLTTYGTKFFALSFEEVYKAYGELDGGQTENILHNDVRRYRSALYTPLFPATAENWDWPDGVARSPYWLRSPGYRGGSGCYVGNEGSFLALGNVNRTDLGTRPACYLDLTISPLLAGPDFNAAVGTTSTEIIFGTFDDLGAANGFVWDNSAKYVDSAGKGTIRLFTSGTKTYVLSQNSSPIYANEDCTGMFLDMTALTKVTGMENVDTRNVTTMFNLFRNCHVLESVDVSNFDTSNVTDMMHLFANCYVVKNLDISGFNTEKVTNMRGMFYHCENVTFLDPASGQYTTHADLSHFNTSNCTNMKHLFQGCYRLTSVDLSSFDTSKVTEMAAMFSQCYYLESLDLTNFDTSSAIDMEAMFYQCRTLKTLNLRNFNTANVTNMKNMFQGSTSLTHIALSNADTRKVTTMAGMFSTCTALLRIYVSPTLWYTGNVSEHNDMFYNCTSIIGGTGMRYNANYTNKTYAHTSGYLTAE